MESADIKYICVVDFEATCVQGMKGFYPHEIIEFPGVLIDAQSRLIISTFHSFVKPTIWPVLSEFCRNLTGITQDSINNAETFDHVLQMFMKWIYGTIKEESFVILTDGCWDMTKFLYLQCLISHIEFPCWAENFIDIKLTYKIYNSKKEKPRLMGMLQSYGLIFEGHLHSGKDDAYNIARLAIAMLNADCILLCNTGMNAKSKKYLEYQLSSYFKKQKNNKKKHQKRVYQKEDLSEIYNDGQMDIDPDLEESEFILLKYKSKRLKF